MLLENPYDTLLSGKEAVLQIVCTIWEKYVRLNIAWILDILSLFVVTNRNMHIKRTIWKSGF